MTLVEETAVVGGFLPALEAELASLVEQQAAPGIVVGRRQGQELAVVAAGETLVGSGRAMGGETRFPLACVIKPLVALCCLELHERGRLSTAEDVTAYLPELGQGGRRGITLEHLLSHTGGFAEPSEPAARWSLDWPGFVDYFAAAAQLSEPGAVWSYTHTGYAILGQVIERVTARPFLDLVQEWLLEPLQVRLAAAGDPQVPRTERAVAHVRSLARRRFEPIRPQAETGLFASSISPLAGNLHDLLTIAGAIAGPHLPPEISDAAFRRFAATRVRIPSASGFAVHEAVPTGYGLGLARFGNVIGQNGSLLGTTCAIRYDVAANVAVAVAANAWAPGLRDWLARKALLGRTDLSPRGTWNGCVRDPALGDLSGDFAGLMLGCRQIHVAVDGDVIEIAGEGDDRLTARLRVLDDGALQIEACSKPWTTFAVAAAPDNGEPYWLVGASAYRRVRRS